MIQEMTKEAFKFLLDCVIDAVGLAESYKHGRRNCETVFCNLVAAKIAHEKFGLTLMKIAEYLDNKPKRSALTLGLRNMNEHVRLFGGYYKMSADRVYNIDEIMQRVVEDFKQYFSNFYKNLKWVSIVLDLRENFEVNYLTPAIAVDEQGYYHIAIYSNGVWYSITSHKIIEYKIVKLRYI